MSEINFYVSKLKISRFFLTYTFKSYLPTLIHLKITVLLSRLLYITEGKY